MTSIEELRRHMDQLNKELKAVLLERLALANEIISLKQQRGLPRQDESREAEILGSILTNELTPFETRYLQEVFQTIFKQTLRNL